MLLHIFLSLESHISAKHYPSVIWAEGLVLFMHTVPAAQVNLVAQSREKEGEGTIWASTKLRALYT